MEDKILDDDDIIDLTDLLEEGNPKPGKEKKEAGASARTPASEPDSFDLGKEISMEYDVSVEEIEQGGEKLDIDASLSATEETVLSREPGGEIDFGFDDAGAKGPDKEEVFPKKAPQVSDAGDAAVDSRPGRSAGEGPARGSAAEFEGAGPSFEEQEFPAGKAGVEIPEETGLDASSPAVPPLVTGAALDELKKELPAMLEGIVRPIMAELVRELIASTREQLPGIVEKVIREEIEKLKKLDS